MKRTAKIWIGIVIGLWAFVALLMVALPDEDNPYEQQNIEIIKLAVDYEVNDLWQSMDAEPICHKYTIDENWIKLWCDADLTTSGQHLVMSRIYENTKGLQGTVIYDIAFKEQTSGKTMNAFYDYTFN